MVCSLEAFLPLSLGRGSDPHTPHPSLPAPKALQGHLLVTCRLALQTVDFTQDLCLLYILPELLWVLGTESITACVQGEGQLGGFQERV